MKLKFPPEWKFEEFPYGIPDEAHRAFRKLIGRIVEGNDAKSVYEDFKHAFGFTSASSDAGWAETDMSTAMRDTQDNAARYVAAFYTGMCLAEKHGIAVPKVSQLNKILSKHEVPLLIEPPHLLLKEGDIEFVPEDYPEETSTSAFVRGPVIGRGGFGTVYRITRKTHTGKYDYAMKVFDPSSFIENKDRARSRFAREMQALNTLQHRGIVPMLEAGLDSEQNPYILMPYIEGKDLMKALKGAEPTLVYEAFDEILRALDFAHKEGILHRDLKPSNILVRASDQQPLILDFGCSYLFEEADESLTTTLIGTSAYIPAEVHQNPKHRDVRQDVYACGVLLYQVITGHLPQRDDYKPVSEFVDDYDGIDRVVLGAIASEKRRTATAKAMREQLNVLV